MQSEDKQQIENGPASDRQATGTGAYESPRAEELDTSVSGAETAAGVVRSGLQPPG